MAYLTQTAPFLLPDAVADDLLRAPPQTSDRRRVAMALLAGVALVSSVLGVGLDGLITFGVLLDSPTVVLLGGMGSTTFTRDDVRADLGQHVPTRAGDYPGTAAPLARR